MDAGHGSHAPAGSDGGSSSMSPSMGHVAGFEAQLMPMQSSFYWGKDMTLLFSSWVTRNPVHYALVVLAVFIFAIAHQFLGYIHKLYSGSSSSGSSKHKHAWLEMLVGVVLYGAHTTTGYLLMLIVMSFNGGVFVAVISGLCLGFLIFQAIERAMNVNASDRA
ncbi:copper transporter 5.1, partial [Selaginella moellendorffii]